MFGRQSVRVTYAHKKRRSRNAGEKLLSSPLEVLPVEMDNIMHSQMVRRMLKRSRRVALPEKFEDKNTELLRDHISKRIKHSGEHASTLETPFSSPPACETAAKSSVPEQLSPVPPAKHSYATSGRLKENAQIPSDRAFSSQTLDSPFSSRPGSANSSPKRKDRGSLSHRSSHHMCPRHKRADHGPPSDAHFRTSDDFNAFTSLGSLVLPETSFYTARSFPFPGAPIHGHEYFYAAQPRSISTPARSRQRKPPNLHESEIWSSVGDTSTGAFIAEYRVPFSKPRSPTPSAGIKMTSVSKLSVGDQSFGFPGTNPMGGDALFFCTCRRSGVLTPPASRSKTCPSSPALDLAHNLGSMDISGDLDTQSDGETRRSSAPVPLSTRARALRNGFANAEPTFKKAVRRMPARNRAGTIRASDFAKPGASSGDAAGLSVSSLANVRRTRSGTIVGPGSKLAGKGTSTGLAAVQSGSEPESDDELLLKTRWVEDMVYLGLSVPPKEVEAEELNLCGRRLSSRRG